MTSAPTSRRPHIIRLAVFAAFLVVLFYLLAVKHVVNIEDVRRSVKATGPLAPFDVHRAVGGARRDLRARPDPGREQRAVVRSAAGCVRDAGCDGRHGGGRELDGPSGRDATARGALLGAARADRIDALIQRRGLWAVVGQRFIPGLSDALASYAFGAFGVPLWQMAVGAFIGSVPRAFVYTALGCIARQPVTGVGVRGDRRVVHHCYRRRLRRTQRIPKVARARRN